MNQTSDASAGGHRRAGGLRHRPQGHQHHAGQPAAAVRGGDSTAIIGYRASNSIDVKIRKLDSASQTLALIVSHGRRRHADQLGELFDRGRLAAGQGCARPRVQRRQGPRRAVRPAVRAGPRQGHLDLRVGGTTPPPPPDADAAARRDGGRAAGARPADRRLLGDGDLGADRARPSVPRARYRPECR